MSSQNNVNAVRELLIKAQGELSTRRTVLKDLRESSERYDQMIQILDDIETLKAVPDKSEEQILSFFGDDTPDALKISERKTFKTLQRCNPSRRILRHKSLCFLTF